MKHPEFLDSGAAWEELRQRMDAASAPAKRAAQQLYCAGLRDVFIPTPSLGVGAMFIVGEAMRLSAIARSEEAVNRALDHRRPLAQWDGLIASLREALLVAGDASAAMLRVPGAGSDVRLVIGTLDEFRHLVETLDDGRA